MLVIRMARAGTKKRPFYHIVLADSRSPRDGRFIERLGYYNPLLPKDKEERLKLDFEKVQAWMKKGAQPSDRVMRFLDAAGIAKRSPRTNPEKAVGSPLDPLGTREQFVKGSLGPAAGIGDIKVDMDQDQQLKRSLISAYAASADDTPANEAETTVSGH